MVKRWACYPIFELERKAKAHKGKDAINILTKELMQQLATILELRTMITYTSMNV